MSMDVRKWIIEPAPTERELLSQAVRRHCTYAVVIAAGLIVVNKFLGNVPWWTPHGYLFVATSISFFNLGGRRLWRSRLGNLVQDLPAGLVLVTMLPCWYFAGGIGYTLTLLLCKKIGIMGAYDTPVRDIFYFGGWTGIVIQLLSVLAGRIHSMSHHRRAPGP